MNGSITKETALGMLRDIGSEDHYFYCNDGHVLRNLYELEEFLCYCEDSTFKYHTDGRNDFCNWVRDIIKDYKLANDILLCRDKLLMAGLTGARIDFLEKKAGLNRGIIKAVKRRLRKNRARAARR